MAGLIQSIKDPVLATIKTQIEAKIPPAQQRGYQEIIVAGLKVMFAPQTHPLMAKYLQLVQQSQNNPTVIAHGIVALIAKLYQASKGKMQLQMVTPAAIVLLCYALEFIEKTQGVTITKDLAAQASQAVAAGLLALFKVGPDQLKQAVTQGTGAAPATPPAQPAPTAGAANPPTPPTGQPAPQGGA